MRDKPLIDWSWVFANLDDIVARTMQHLQLALLAVTAGFVIAMTLAILTARHRRAYAGVTAFTGILYTIPSIAAFAALVPLTGLSVLTALIPLTAYTLLVLVRNIVSGLTSVAPEVIEAADAMGYSARQRLLRIELPLAIPLVIAGLRIATVSTIGLVTIASTIGDRFGGLGVFINEGLQQFFPTKVYVGALLSVVLAIAIDLLFVAIQRAMTPWDRPRPEAGPGETDQVVAAAGSTPSGATA